MDTTPFDIDMLTRLANDLFKGDLGGASAIPSAPGQPVPGAPAVAPFPGHGQVPGAPASEVVTTPSVGVPAGGAAVSPSAPPTRPALGLTPAFDAPFTAAQRQGATGGFTSLPAAPFGVSLAGFDNPYFAPFSFKDAPGFPESFHEDAEIRALLAPRDGAIPGFAPIPHVGPVPDVGPVPFGNATGGVAPIGGLPAPDVAFPTQGGLTPASAPHFYFVDEGYFADDVPKLPAGGAALFNAGAVRDDFPIFKQRVNGHPLIWLDNGATTQKPKAVIDRIAAFYANENSNIHRAAHELAARATDAYEDARKTVQRFINAPSVEELIFVRGTTEGINFVAQSFGRRFIGKGDEIVLTQFEHHANIVPWYLLAKEVGAVLKVVPVDDRGEILLDEYERLLNDRTKIVAFTHVSNALGTVLPAKLMTEIAHRHGIPVLLDGAQSISHMPIDVQDIGCDFFIFSGHKVFGPTGIGVVYGRKAYLDAMPPWQGGGNMIKDVTFERIEFQPAPFRFEAGTGNIADAVGLGEALKYLERIGMPLIARHEHDVLDYALHRLREIKSLRIIGDAKERAGVISFLLDGIASDEVGKALNQKGIAVRAGHHCAMPILRRFGVEATVRPSFAIYNTMDDVDKLADAVRAIAINRAN